MRSVTHTQGPTPTSAGYHPRNLNLKGESDPND